MGQAITNHHLRLTCRDAALPFFVADSPLGQDYLHDQKWAREYARQNRRRIMRLTAELLDVALGIRVDEGTIIHSDHNHVQVEDHGGKRLLVHRKGAQSAREDEAGVIPGSMGTASFHVTGRGHAKSLRTSSHGAGRRLSRHAARQAISTKDLRRQMGSVIFDVQRARSLCDESPEAYKDIRRVMRAQRELVMPIKAAAKASIAGK